MYRTAAVQVNTGGRWRVFGEYRKVEYVHCTSKPGKVAITYDDNATLTGAVDLAVAETRAQA